MNTLHESSVSDHDQAVAQYYGEATPGFYIRGWNPDHIHFGLFEDGECPEEGESLADSAGLARAVVRMIDVIVAPAAIGAGDHVVDAGCGIGGTAMHLVKTRGCTVTGVNICRPQLEIAEKKVRDAGLDDRIGFTYGDCSQHLPFADGSIDVVTNIESACHYGDRGQFLREVARILKPGGRIVAMDWAQCDGVPADLHKRYIEPLCRHWLIRSLESRSSYAERLRESGLTVIEVDGFGGKDEGNIHLLEYAYRLLFMLWFGGMSTERHRMLMDQLQTLSMAWRDGCFELARYCAEKPENT